MTKGQLNELEKAYNENAELRAKFAKKADSNHSPVEQMADLESENAELKSRDCCKSCEYANPKSELIEQHIKDVQNLTKAIEIIKDQKELLDRVLCGAETLSNFAQNTLYKAEQFISEVEK